MALSYSDDEKINDITSIDKNLAKSKKTGYLYLLFNPSILLPGIYPEDSSPKI